MQYLRWLPLLASEMPNYYGPTSFLPSYVKLHPIELFRIGSEAWRRSFPFSAPNGQWAFSGRVALFVGLKRLGLRPGSTILVPAYHQGVEIDTLIAAGHVPKFYRVQPDLRPDLSDVAEKLTPEVSALYVTHYFGFPQKLEEVVRLAEQRGIPLIEDCALSMFSRDGDVWVGSTGDLSIFSIYKAVPLPHGGYLVMKQPCGDTGLVPPPFRSTVLQTGNLIYQYLTSVSPEVGRVLSRTSRIPTAALKTDVVSGRDAWQPELLRFSASAAARHLMRLVDPDEVIRRRRENFARLESILAEAEVKPFGELKPGVCPLFYPCAVTDKLALREELAHEGVGTTNLWYHPHPACPKDLSNEVEPWRKRVLQLPIHQQLDAEDIDRIGYTVLRLLAKRKLASFPARGTLRSRTYLSVMPADEVSLSLVQNGTESVPEEGFAPAAHTAASSDSATATTG